jgi:hypothetical protein
VSFRKKEDKNSNLEAALGEARMQLGLLWRLGALRSGGDEEGRDPSSQLALDIRAKLTFPEHVRHDGKTFVGMEMELSEEERKYLLKLLPGIRRVQEPAKATKQKPERGRRSNTSRDRFLASVIEYITNKYSLAPNRNRTAQRGRDDEEADDTPTSGFSIVARVLSELSKRFPDPKSEALSERHLERIWGKQKQGPRYTIPKWIEMSEADQRQIDEALQRARRGDLF